MSPWALFLRSNRGAKPAAFEACPAKPIDDERTAPHEAPNQSRSVVFDHQNHRTLIQGEVSMGDPTCLVLRRPAKRRVDAAHEPVFRNGPRKPLQIVVDSWEDDFGSERKRRRRRPRCERPVVGPEWHAARAVPKKVARLTVQSQRDRAGSVAGAETPREFAVPDKPPRIADRIFALNVGRPAAVLEVVD